jgi:hypothetical protein
MPKKKENTFYLLLLGAAIIAILVYKNYRSEQNDIFSENGRKTVGLIFKRNLPGARTISSISYSYIYYVDNTKYEGGSLSDEKYLEGSYFEVTYLPESPEKSRMEFNQPVITDSVCVYFEGNCPFKKE